MTCRFTAVISGESKVNCDSFCVAEMQKPVWFGRKTCDNALGWEFVVHIREKAPREHGIGINLYAIRLLLRWKLLFWCIIWFLSSRGDSGGLPCPLLLSFLQFPFRHHFACFFIKLKLSESFSRVFWSLACHFVRVFYGEWVNLGRIGQMSS